VCSIEPTTISELNRLDNVAGKEQFDKPVTQDAQALDEARVKRLLAIHPPTAGVLVFDDTGLPKKGTESVGVEPQYCGRL
jgi:SRSO17 transposase